MDKNLNLRKLSLEDVYQMKEWKSHDDPFFYHYNFDCKTDENIKNWFRSKKIFLVKDIFGMFIENKLIGFITIKNYKFFKRQAEMGVSMDLNYVNKGYGTKFIEMYLDYVFSNTIFEKIVLRTVEFNKRAIKSYEKVGFKLIAIKGCLYEEQRYKKNILSRYENVLIKNGVIFTNYYFMEIRKDEFRKDEF